MNCGVPALPQGKGVQGSRRSEGLREDCVWGGDCGVKGLQQVTRAETARQAEGPELRTCWEKGQAEARQVTPGPRPLPRDRLGWWSEEVSAAALVKTR